MEEGDHKYGNAALPLCEMRISLPTMNFEITTTKDGDVTWIALESTDTMTFQKAPKLLVILGTILGFLAMFAIGAVFMMLAWAALQHDIANLSPELNSSLPEIKPESRMCTLSPSVFSLNSKVTRPDAPAIA
jgi:hypothetical protein